MSMAVQVGLVAVALGALAAVLAIGGADAGQWGAFALLALCAMTALVAPWLAFVMAARMAENHGLTAAATESGGERTSGGDHGLTAAATENGRHGGRPSRGATWARVALGWWDARGRLAEWGLRRAQEWAAVCRNRRQRWLFEVCAK
jgi:hypothetical protein